MKSSGGFETSIPSSLPPSGATGGELSGTYPNPTLVNSAVIGKVITGYVSGAGTVAATDTILQAIQKLNGNALLLVTGAASSTDNAVARFDSTTGKIIQNSVVIVSDTGATSGITTLGITNLLTINTGVSNALPISVERGTGSADILEFFKTGFTDTGAIYQYSDANGAVTGLTVNTTVSDGGVLTRPNTSHAAWTINVDSRSATSRFLIGHTTAAGVATNALIIDTNDNLILVSTTACSGTGTGAIQVIGGQYIGGKLFVGNDVVIKAGASSAELAKVGGVVYTSVTTTGNVGTGEDTLFSYTTPVNMLGTDKQSLVGSCAGTFGASANNKRLRVKFGATTIFDSGALAITLATDWTLEIEIIRVGNTSQKCNVRLTTNSSTLLAYADYAVSSETLSGTVILLVTGEATDNNDIVGETFKVRWEGAE